jgi:succinate dehydrogenase / fumarate reductase membrane anchor subunit
VTHNSIRRVLVWALWLAAAFLILLGTLVVFTFDPCLGVTQDSSLWDMCQGVAG